MDGWRDIWIDPPCGYPDEQSAESTQAAPPVCLLVLYDEGLMVLTGSWDLNSVHTAKYVTDGGGAVAPRWNAFGRKTEETVSSSFGINVRGTQKLNMITYFN